MRRTTSNAPSLDIPGLFAECRGAAYAVVHGILRHPEDASDALQDVFIEAWRRRAEFDGERGEKRAWICTIARSRALDRLRYRSSRPDLRASRSDVLEDGCPAVAGNLEEQTVQAQERHNIATALATLPLKQREALRMVYFEGLSDTETARRTGQPRGTVKSQLRLGLEKLADSLTRDLGDAPLRRQTLSRGPLREDPSERRILIVEDDEDARALLARYLSQHGYSVETVPDGLSALRALRGGGDGWLVLLDLRMRGLNGWQLLEALTDDLRLSRTPVIVMSAVVNERCLPRGVQAVLPKPLDLGVLMRAISMFALPSSGAARAG